MTKVEKQFRKILKDKYFAWQDDNHFSKVRDHGSNLICHEYCLMCDLAEEIFPNIDIERCERKWKKEWSLLNE